MGHEPLKIGLDRAGGLAKTGPRGLASRPNDTLTNPHGYPDMTRRPFPPISRPSAAPPPGRGPVGRGLSALITVAAVAALSACSGSDWPRLSDPLPRAEDRQRVIERARPAEPLRAPDPVPATVAEAESLLSAIAAALRADRQAFEAALSALTDNRPEDTAPIGRSDWIAAQLALTRLSHTSERLDPLADMAPDTETDADANTGAMAPVRDRAARLRRETDAYVVTARKRLGRLQN